MAWFPAPDAEPLVVADIGDAACLVFELFDSPMRDAALILLDTQRRVIAILLDPPPGPDCLFAWAQRLEPTMDFAATILVVVQDEITDGPPSDTELLAYETMCTEAIDHGVLLLDIVFANPDKIRSMAFASDPECIWTEPFEP